MVEVNGRPRRKWVVALLAEEGQLVVRLDDDADPAFWEEIRITETELLRALAKVHRMTHGDKKQLHIFDETVIGLGEALKPCECDKQPHST